MTSMTTPPRRTRNSVSPLTDESQAFPQIDLTSLDPMREEIPYKQAERLAAWVNSKYHEMKSARTKQQRQWYLNMAFNDGRQHVEFMKGTGQLKTPPAPPWRVRSVTNLVAPVIRSEMARLTSQEPSASVVPSSSEDEDLMAAAAGEQIWEYLRSQKKLPAVFRRSIWWALICGDGFLKTWWDSQCAPQGQPDEVIDGGAVGDICYGSVTPFHLFVPDLREETLEGQPYTLHAYTRPVDWVKQFWGSRMDGKEINPSVTNSTEILDEVHLNLGGSTNAEPDSVMVFEMWIKPGGHPDFPQGGMLSCIDGNVMQVRQNGMGYKHGMYPFTKFGHIPTGKFYSKSTIEDMIPLQREFNRTRSQIIEAKNRMAKPQLIYPRGSLDPSKITTQPGQMIPYHPALGKPEPLPLQPLPNYVLNELMQITGDIENVTGQHAVSKGDAPPGVTAATAISFLQEKDDAYLAPTYQSVEEGFEDIAQKTLQLVVQFWDVPRMIRVTGLDGAFDASMFSGSDIKNGTDIRMEGGSALPTSKAARQALLMDLGKLGFIPPEEVLKLMEIGGVQKLYERLRIDERQAQRENIRFKRMRPEEIMAQKQEFLMRQSQGDPSTFSTPDPNAMAAGPVDPAMGMADPNVDPNLAMAPDPMSQPQPLDPPPAIPVNTWDNHAAHIMVHDNFRKSQAFEVLPEEVKVEIETHVQQHKIAMGMQMQEQAAMQAMAMPGGAPEAGPGGDGSNQFSGNEGMTEENG